MPDSVDNVRSRPTMTDSDDDRLREEQIAECIQLINTKAKDAERTEALRQEVLTHQREIEKIEFDAKKLWSIHEYLQMARDAKQAMVSSFRYNVTIGR